MTPRIRRTPQANDDLFSIWEHVAQRNTPAADPLIRRFDEAFRTLASHPGIVPQGKQRGPSCPRT